MMRCKYLCIQARIKSPSLLSGFQGWGLHLMTVQDGLDLTFVTKEIKVYIPRNDSDGFLELVQRGESLEEINRINKGRARSATLALR